MENIKEKIPMFIALIVAIAVIVGAIYFTEYHIGTYYTQIDNSKVTKLSTTDDMKYQYKLTCYNKNGFKKEFTFKTSRELRENAFLELETTLIVGVRKWKEVQYNELPEKVRVNYPEI